MGFWEKKQVVVTGGAGFLGASVVERLRARGCQAVFVPRSSEYNLVDMAAVQRLYRDTRPQMVIHLAARVGGIGKNQRNPATFFYDNLLMGVQLLDQAYRFGVEKFVAIGTVCAYPKWCPVPFREASLWDGYPEETNAPYGLAKKMLLVQSQAYRAQYGFHSIFLIPVNLYGPRDNFDLEDSHVIPALIRKCLEAQAHGEGQIVLWGDGSATREFLYVEDAAEGIVLAAERYEGHEPVNIGTGHDISIRDLAALIIKLTGFQGRVTWDGKRPNGQPRRQLDVSRAQETFGFHAATSLEAGLQRTIQWYRETVVRRT